MKTLTLFIIFFLLAGILQSQSIIQGDAMLAAKNFMKHTKFKKSTGIEIKSSFDWISNETQLYAFNFEGGGWIILSSDERVTPALGFSNIGEISQETISPAAKNWINHYCE